MSGQFLGFRLRFQFPQCRTLKDRRSRVESVIHSAKSRHGFSAADLSVPLKVDYAEVGFAAVGHTEYEIRSRLDRVISEAEGKGDLLLLGVEELNLSEGD